MKKVNVARILFIVLISIMLSGCKKEDPSISKSTVEDILRSVYTPKSMEEFNKAKEKYSGTILTEEVANELYKSNSDELTEKDLARTIDIRVDYSDLKNNSIKDDIYRATINLHYDGNSTKAEIVFFVNSEGLIYKYTTTIL